MVNKILKIAVWIATVFIVCVFAFMIFEAITLLKDKNHYEENWNKLKNKYFSGIIPKIIASLALVISIYAIVTRKFSIYVSIMLYVVAIIFAYMPPVLKLIFR